MIFDFNKDKKITKNEVNHAINKFIQEKITHFIKSHDEEEFDMSIVYRYIDPEFTDLRDFNFIAPNEPIIDNMPKNMIIEKFTNKYKIYEHNNQLYNYYNSMDIVNEYMVPALCRIIMEHILANKSRNEVDKFADNLFKNIMLDYSHEGILTVLDEFNKYVDVIEQVYDLSTK